MDLLIWLRDKHLFVFLGFIYNPFIFLVRTREVKRCQKNKEKLLQRWRDYWANNKEKILQKNKENYQRRKVEILSQQALYRQNHKVEARIKNLRDAQKQLALKILENELNSSYNQQFQNLLLTS